MFSAALPVNQRWMMFSSSSHRNHDFHKLFSIFKPNPKFTLSGGCNIMPNQPCPVGCIFNFNF